MLLQDAKELDVAHLWAQEYQEDEPIREFFTAWGFVEVKRFTLPDQPPMVVYLLDLHTGLERACACGAGSGPQEEPTTG